LRCRERSNRGQISLLLLENAALLPSGEAKRGLRKAAGEKKESKSELEATIVEQLTSFFNLIVSENTEARRRSQLGGEGRQFALATHKESCYSKREEDADRDD